MSKSVKYIEVVEETYYRHDDPLESYIYVNKFDSLYKAVKYVLYMFSGLKSFVANKHGLFWEYNTDSTYGTIEIRPYR